MDADVTAGGGEAAGAKGPGATPRAEPGSRGTNQAGVRLWNERLVLSLVRRHGPLPKAEIARLTGLSAMTTTTIMNRLEADGLLLRGEKTRGRVGQPSVPYGLNPDGAFALGLKVGRRSSDLMLVDFAGRVRACERIAHAYPDPASVFGWLEGAREAVLGVLPPSLRGRVTGTGVASPFELWTWDAGMGASPRTMAAWRDCDLSAEVATRTGLQTFVCNDATAACAAELMIGAGARHRDFVYCFIGSFVGGGLVLDRTLYPGRTGNAAAIGSMPVATLTQDGRLVRPQLLRQASLYLLEEKLRDAGRDPSHIWRQPDDWSGIGDLLDLWIEETAAALAPALIACTAVIDVEAIVIDGACPPDVRRRVVEAVSAQAAALDRRGLSPVRFIEGTVGHDARAIGAAMLPLMAGFAPDREVLFKEGDGRP
ncbi:ROK family transcriptional regulator [Alsobacter sp. R-9]